VSTTVDRARWLRGALVGLCSAVVTAAAHTAGGGGLPSGSALIVAVVVCATTGAAIGGVGLCGRRTRPLGVIAALTVAQVLGHLTLVIAGGHHHHAAGLGVTPSMLSAHLGAAVVLGAAICAVEFAYVVAASVLCWLRLFAAAAPRPAVRVLPRPANVVAPQPVLLLSGLGMRAPPRVISPAA
jgi:hypothetical protein